MEHASGPVPLPVGVTVRNGTAKGLTLASPAPVAPGAILEFDLLLGARPLPVMARVLDCRAGDGAAQHVLELEFLAMAQVDRDSLADFLTAVGPSALHIRPHAED